LGYSPSKVIDRKHLIQILITRMVDYPKELLMDRRHDSPVLKIAVLVYLLLIFGSGLITIVSADNNNDISDAAVIKEAPANAVPPGFANPVKPALTAPVIKEKIATGLTNQMQKTAKGDKIKVAIWLTTPGYVEPRRPLPDDPVASAGAPEIAQTTEMTARGKTAIATAEQALIVSLAEKKVAVDYASPYSPLVFATLSRDEIKDLAARSDVTSVDIDHNMEPTLDNAGLAILAQKTQSVIPGAAKIAIVECDGVAFSNPYLKSTKQVALYQDSKTPNIGAHATACAGIAQSTHSTIRGVAYKGEAAVMSANCPPPHNWKESSLISAQDWAVANGAEVLSNSWGPTEPDDGPLWTVSKHDDWLVRNNNVTIVVAAGNQGDQEYPTNTVGDPAKAFNVIAVGSFKNQATGLLWWDDVMSSFSSWGDPTQPGGNARIKPEVVASGETTTGNFKSTLTASPWVGWYGSAGTSFAAPAVAGEAAILINNTPWLAYWPEAVKAVIMASADHNIEGNSKVSDYDGVGAVNVYEAYKIAHKSSTSLPDNVMADTLDYDGGAPYYFKNGVWNLTLSQGTRTRFVLVYDSRPTSFNSADALNADLDLYVERKVGTNWVIEPLAGNSISPYNNFEIIDFNAPVTGRYRVKVVKSDWLDPEYTECIGFAVYTKTYTPEVPTVITIKPNFGPTTGGTSVTITGNGFNGATGVIFGTSPASAFTVNSAIQIIATSPAGTAGTVDVTVTTPAGTSATSPADEFTYIPQVPEFPSAILSATMIIGFLGAVLLVQKTREH
jgi:hypothetical protein